MMKTTFVPFALISLCLFGQAHSSHAQERDGASGSYFYALGSLLAESRSVQHTVDLCTREFPDTRAENQRAVDAWKGRHKTLFLELDGHVDRLPAYWKSLDPRSAKAAPMLMKQLEKMYADLPKIIEKEHLVQHSKEEFGLVCSNFPAILEQERWDFEKYHAHELATVRRGPPR